MPGTREAANGGRAEGGEPRSTGKEIEDVRLGDLVRLLDMLPKYLRAMSLTLRSVYSTTTRYVAAFDRLQRELAQEASVLKVFLLPVTVEVIIQLQRFVDHYLLSSCDVWQRKIRSAASSALECQVLFRSLADFYAHLDGDLAKFRPLVKDVREALVQETLKFQREAGVLSIRSLVKDNVFVALLFVPVVDCYAAPMVHGGERHDFAKPVVAKDEFERAVAAAMAVADTLIPTVEKLGRLLRVAEGFFGDLVAELQDLGASPAPPGDEDDDGAEGSSKKKSVWEREPETGAPAPTPEERAALEAKRGRHYETVRPKAFWIEKSCREMKALAGNIVSDMLLPASNVPDPEPADYAQQWLETRKNSAGQDIVDLARAATRNVEILDAMDP